MRTVLGSALLPLLPPVTRAAGWLLDWLATYAVHSTLLIGAVWLVTSEALGRRLRLTNSTHLWRLALVGAIVTATLQSTGVLTAVTGTVRLAGELRSRTSVAVMISRAVDAHAPASPVVTTRVEVQPAWSIIIVVVWAIGAATGLMLLWLAHRRFMRSLAPRQVGEHTLAGAALRELRRRAGVRHNVALRVARRLSSPLAIGSEEICLPERALAEFDIAQLESILAHELAHLERHDSTWLIAARMIEGVFFFQPLNRLARRRMMESAELDADARAISVTSRPVTLAKCLARVAEWTSSERTLFAPAMAERRTSSLIRRVRRLTSEPEPPPAPAMRNAALAALIGLAAAAPRATVGAPTPHPHFGSGRIMIWTNRGVGDQPAAGVLTADRDVMLLRVQSPESRVQR